MIELLQRAACGFGVVVSVGLAACSTIDSHTRVTGWPELKVVEHHVSHAEMRDRCAPYVGPWMSPMGCTLYYFDQREAHIYVSKDFPSEAVLEHERLHAAGYDHPGSDSMQAILQDWRARNRLAAHPQE